MLEAETFVCRNAKQIIPATSIKTELNPVSVVVESDLLKLPTKPRLRISNNAPKTIPLIAASDNNRLLVSE
ncbi:MAG: hypothetical protein ABSD41_01210 [Candidatus Bathyarchaeia archaeon]